MTLTPCDVCAYLSNIAGSLGVTRPILSLCVPRVDREKVMLCDQHQAQDVAMERLIRYLDRPEWVVLRDKEAGKGRDIASMY